MLLSTNTCYGYSVPPVECILGRMGWLRRLECIKLFLVFIVGADRHWWPWQMQRNAAAAQLGYGGECSV